MIIIAVGLCNWLNGQTSATISELSIDYKRNGLFVHLRSTIPVKSEHITGWSTDKNWFYITILGASSDTTALTASKLKYPVTAIQVTNTRESTQIALRVVRPIENFEFYQSKNPPEILLSMRFPVEEVIAALVEEKEDLQRPGKAGGDKPSTISSRFYYRLKTALYLIGTSLSIAGIIEQDNTDGLGWELPLGLTILGGTYIFDTYLYPQFTGD